MSPTKGLLTLLWRDEDMKTLIATLALCTVVAAPAFAQSYDPDLGSGNVGGFTAAPAYAWSVEGAYARVVPAHRRTRAARNAYNAYNAVTPYGSPTDSGNPSGIMTGARETALRECSTASRQYTETTWGDQQMQTFRSCMMRHGQPE